MVEKLQRPEDHEVFGNILSNRYEREAAPKKFQQYGYLNKTWTITTVDMSK